MTDKKTEALKLALEALESLFSGKADQDRAKRCSDAITAIREALAEQPAQQQPVAWRDHVEQRLLTWRQSFVNKSGDQLALNDFMDKQSLDDLIDFVCSEYTSPPASKPWVGLTMEDMYEIGGFKNTHGYVPNGFKRLVAVFEAKLREKNA